MRDMAVDMPEVADYLNGGAAMEIWNRLNSSSSLSFALNMMASVSSPEAESFPEHNDLARKLYGEILGEYNLKVLDVLAQEMPDISREELSRLADMNQEELKYEMSKLIGEESAAWLEHLGGDMQRKGRETFTYFLDYDQETGKVGSDDLAEFLNETFNQASNGVGPAGDSIVLILQDSFNEAASGIKPAEPGRLQALRDATGLDWRNDGFVVLDAPDPASVKTITDVLRDYRLSSYAYDKRISLLQTTFEQITDPSNKDMLEQMGQRIKTALDLPDNSAKPASQTAQITTNTPSFLKGP